MIRPMISPKRYITSKGDVVESTLNGREAYDMLMSKPYRSGFEESLCNAFRLSNGNLSKRQMPWFMKCAMEEKKRKDNYKVPDSPKGVPHKELPFSMLDTFNRIRDCPLKWPKILIGCGDTKTWKLGKAGNKSREPNTVTIYEHQSKDFYGRIFPDGKVVIKTSWDRKDLEHLVVLLKLVEHDPQAAALMYGTATNNCMFCGKELTHPFSVKHKYGPICAEHYGLYHAFNDPSIPNN